GTGGCVEAGGARRKGSLPSRPRAVSRQRVPVAGVIPLSRTRSSTLTAGFVGAATAAAARSPDEARRLVRPGRCGPGRDCNHIDLPLGTGPRRPALPKRTRYVVA